MSDPPAGSPSKAPASFARNALLALADLRTPEQVEADAEIDASNRDETDELVLRFQSAAAETASFLDYWYAHNNLPSPPSPFAYVMELMGRDLVAEETMQVISRQVIRRKSGNAAQLSLL